MPATKKRPHTEWPKMIPLLTPEQVVISDDFMKYRHEVLPRRYGFVDKFNHNHVAKTAPKPFLRTLEIGAGNGEHLKYERLKQEQKEIYYAVDIRENMLV